MNITDNLKLGSTSYGDPNAPKLVVTPGWATDSNFLKPFVSLFPDYNVILLDMPGYGKSEELKQFSISTRQTANLILNSIPKDLSIYTEDSVKNLQFVIDMIQRELPKSMQDTVDQYEVELTKALTKLQLKSQVNVN